MRPPPPRDDLRFSNTTGILRKKKTMWFTGVEVEQEPSAPPPKKILDPLLTTRPLPRQLFLDYSPPFLRQLGTSSQWLITWKGGSYTDIFHILYYNWGKEHHSLNPVNPLSPSINI